MEELHVIDGCLAFLDFNGSEAVCASVYGWCGVVIVEHGWLQADFSLQFEHVPVHGIGHGFAGGSEAVHYTLLQRGS
jgi:hypothetical protein